MSGGSGGWPGTGVATTSEWFFPSAENTMASTQWHSPSCASYSVHQTVANTQTCSCQHPKALSYGTSQGVPEVPPYPPSVPPPTHYHPHYVHPYADPFTRPCSAPASVTQGPPPPILPYPPPGPSPAPPSCPPPTPQYAAAPGYSWGPALPSLQIPQPGTPATGPQRIVPNEVMQVSFFLY